MVLDPMHDQQAVLIYITTESQEQARAIATTVVEQKLAACANIVPAIESIFFWEGTMQHSNESLLLLKSTQDRVEALCAAVKALHSYTCPCIVALPLTGGNPDFMRWVHSTTHP